MTHPCDLCGSTTQASGATMAKKSHFLHPTPPLHYQTQVMTSDSADGLTTPARAPSPTSSQGSWVVDPEDGGWDGLGASPTPSLRAQQQLHLEQQQQQQRRQGSPGSSPLRSWAQVPPSPPAAEYPSNASPPGSPGSVKSAGSSGRAAGEGLGLVGLARGEIQDGMEVSEAPAACPSVSPSASMSYAGGSGGGEQRPWTGGESMPASVGCVEIGDDVDIVDVSASDVDAPVVITGGMSSEEAAEAIAEAVAAGAPLPSPSRVAVSPSRPAGGAVAQGEEVGRGAVTSPLEPVQAQTPPRRAAGLTARSPSSVSRVRGC